MLMLSISPDAKLIARYILETEMFLYMQDDEFAKK